MTPERKRQYLAEWRNKNRDRIKEYNRRNGKLNRQRRKSRGLCMWCGRRKPRKDRTYCALCADRHKVLRRRRTVERYGINEKEYTMLLKKQKGRCGICRKLPTRKALAIDHNHKTKKVRGLLCGNCNNGLGRFKDSINRLKAAVEYLTRAKSELVWVN